MSLLLALMLAALCLGSLALAVTRPGILTTFAATASLFTLGYYCLPVFLIGWSTLAYLPESEVSAASAMAFLYTFALVGGMVMAASRAATVKGLRFHTLDRLVEEYWWIGAIASNAIIILYNSTRTLTFYQVERVEYFVEDRSVIEGLLGFFGGLAQALAAVYMILALRQRSLPRIAFCAVALAVQLATVLGAGQRLIFITPLILLLAAAVSKRQFRMAGSILGAAVATLLLISPFAVAVRAGAWNSAQEEQAESFTYGADPVTTMLQSIVDRADILQNTATLKTHVDREGYVSGIYYLSVAAVPVPRFFYKTKPHILSDTGTIDGEASVLAWRLSVSSSSLGSLTAFGPIIAYREGGWFWMIANGVLTGVLFAFVLNWFSRGGFMAQAFFAIVFANWAVRKVFPSLFEALVDMMTYLPIFAGLYVLNRLLAQMTVNKNSEDQALASAALT